MRKSDPRLIIEQWAMLIRDELQKHEPIPDIECLSVVEREKLECCVIKDLPAHLRAALPEARRKGLIVLLKRAMDIYLSGAENDRETTNLNSFNLGYIYGLLCMLNEMTSTPVLACSERNLKELYGVGQKMIRETRKADAPPDLIKRAQDDARTLKEKKPSWNPTRIADHLRDNDEALKKYSPSAVRAWVRKSLKSE